MTYVAFAAGSIDPCLPSMSPNIQSLSPLSQDHLNLLQHARTKQGELCRSWNSSERTPPIDLLAFAKNIADRVEAQSARAKVPVAVCVIDIHGNIILKHRMSGAPAFSIELSERKAYTSALVGLRTADLSPLVLPGQELFPLMGLSGGRFCSMGGGAPLTSEGQLVAGVDVSGGTVEQDVNILESALREAVRPALTATS
jgi:uncharacterized protein GlcG (DUF336 family)